MQATILEDTDRLRVSIVPAKEWRTLAPILAFLALIVVMVLAATIQIAFRSPAPAPRVAMPTRVAPPTSLEPPPPLLIVGAAVVVIFGLPTSVASMVFIVAWSFWGRERIEIDRGALSLRRHVGRFGRTSRFDIRAINDVRYAPEFSPWWHDTFKRRLGIAPDKLAFDYGSATVRFAPGLAEAEARPLAERLANRVEVGRQLANFGQDVGLGKPAATSPISATGAVEVPRPPRSTVRSTVDTLTIQMPRRRSWSKAALVAGLVVVFTLLILANLVTFVRHSSEVPSMSFPFLLSFVLGPLAVWFLVVIWRRLVGHDVLELSCDRITIGWTLFGYRSMRAFPLHRLNGARFHVQPPHFLLVLAGIRPTLIVVDLVDTRINLGEGLDEAEAKRVVADLRDWLAAVRRRPPSSVQALTSGVNHTVT